MSRSTPQAASLSRGSNGTKAATPLDASGLFQTLQGHVDDIRGLLQCGICIRPLYEPFTLACGHTFCYGCLTSWFAEGRANKTCPDCRAAVKSQPAPAYLVRAVVQLFTSRPELLDKGETTDQHRAHQLEEAEKLETDKKNTIPGEGGLFRGIFNKARYQPAQPIVDLEDGVVRCPQCSWEMEETFCGHCGFGHDDDSMSGTDWRTDSEMNSDMTDDPYDDEDEEIEDGFGIAPGFDWGEWYDGHDGLPLEALPELRYHPVVGLGRGFGIMPGNAVFHGHSDFDSHDSVHDDDGDEDDEDEDEDMDSFIDDGQPSEDYASESDRSTVVGHPDYTREELHAIFDESASSGYSTAHSNIYDFNAVPDSEDDEDETEHERHVILSTDDSDDSEREEDHETMESDDSDDDEDDEDDDDDEGPIRPAVAGNRRRIPTYHILSSSSPLRANGGIALNPTVNGTNSHLRRPQQPPSAGSSATRAIALDDDSDEEPVDPMRRARDRGAYRPSAL
ncbi:hypothetical protein BDV12DRAFT_98739 [Aspergillus spectabilis]